MPLVPRRIFHGAIVHSLSLTEIEYLPSALLGVNQSGTIAFLDRDVPSSSVKAKVAEHGWEGAEVVVVKKGEFLCPGFIDTHTHAPQYPNLGFGQQFELLDWLSHVTFPTETKFADAQYARRTYEGVVQRVIDTGTTTVCYYGTHHLTTKILAAVCHRKGQRAFVGKCNMDRHSGDYQESSAEVSLKDTKEFVNFVRTNCVLPEHSCSPDGTALPTTTTPALPAPTSTSSIAALRPGSLVQPILTPRFAISCSDALLEGLGEMMKADPTLPLQTHLAENPSEIEFTKSLFPFADSYTAVYDHFNLLRSNSVLAHCVHLDKEEMELIKKTDAGISHCPTSNFNLRSGTSRVAELLDRGIKVSLGTDVAGGFGLGILTNIRQASIASKTIVFQARDSAPSPEPQTFPDNHRHDSHGATYPAGYFSNHHLSIETLFYLATLGGAEVTCLEDKVGNFVVGKEFDALLVQSGQKTEEEAEVSREGRNESDEEIMEGVELVDPFPTGFNPAMFVEPTDSLEKIFEKGDDRNLGSVFVRGRCIGGARPLSP
ncbi:guanine deaminase [Pseudohyphozyma bogoriensis]|nr:guanine deaminase [Pseudohyphozyma bogoriensis]